MRSLVLDFDHPELRERETREPTIAAASDVLFRVHEVGICGTDRELVNYRLLPRPGDSRRIVLGHEALGQVIECGSGVRSLRPGDWVVPTVRRGCTPACENCARNRTDLCLSYGYSERGIFNLDGYFCDYAVDCEADLIAIPPSILDHAILLEPLSVVEKAVERAVALRQGGGSSALVLGLGPIGMLSALALQARGYRVTIHSLEAEDHPRAMLMRSADVAYTASLSGAYDVIIEAAGSAELALKALSHLSSCGVFITLGARSTLGEFSFIHLIVGNQTIAGSVNSSPESFRRGVEDLSLFPRSVLDRMIRRFPFSAFQSTLFDPPPGEPKFVHRMSD